MKLGIGTVQFGLEYGVNQRRLCTRADVEKILNLAAERSIAMIDTAAAYGCSEEILGQLLPVHHSFKIVSKYSASATCSVAEIEKQIQASLVRLKQQQIYGVLWHKPEELLSPQGEMIWAGLQAAKKKGLIKKAGVSVYTTEQIAAITAKFPIDLIQLPINILDQRLIHNGWLQKLKKAGVEIHARSVFLQGALLLDPSALPAHLKSAYAAFKKWHDACQIRQESVLQASLRFVLDRPEVDSVIVGISSYNEFLEIVAAAAEPSAITDAADYAISNEAILNPTLWPKIAAEIKV